MSNQRETLHLLTRWSSRKAAKEFKVSRGVIAKARKLKSESGIFSMPCKRMRKSILVKVHPKVLEFFRMDSVSRMLSRKTTMCM